MLFQPTPMAILLHFYRLLGITYDFIYYKYIDIKGL